MKRLLVIPATVFLWNGCASNHDAQRMTNLENQLASTRQQLTETQQQLITADQTPRIQRIEVVQDTKAAQYMREALKGAKIISYRKGVGGFVTDRATLPPGAWIDNDGTYHSAPESTPSEKPADQ